MDYLFIFLVISFLFLVVILYKKRKKKEKLLQGSKKQELLVTLNELLKEIKKPSVEKKMNKEEIKKIKEEIEKVLEESLDGKLSELNIETNIKKINQSIAEIEFNTKREFNRKDNIIKNINYEVGRFKTYLSTNVFCPKNLIFNANKLQGKVVDLQDSEPEKLTKLMNDIEKEFLHFQNDLKEFFRLHNKLRSLLTNVPELTGNEKQEIYFFIQNGELQKAEELMDKFFDIEAEDSISKEHEKNSR